MRRAISKPWGIFLEVFKTPTVRWTPRLDCVLFSEGLVRVVRIANLKDDRDGIIKKLFYSSVNAFSTGPREPITNSTHI